MNLTDKEKEMISLLAREGLKTYYDFFKKEGGIASSSTAYKLLKDLKKKHLIEVKKEKAFDLRGRKKKFYGLTLEGLVIALLQPESWKHIDQIAKRGEKLLPFVFKRWVLFKKHGLAEEARKALGWGAKVLATDWRYEHRWVDGGRACMEERFIERMITLSRSIEVRMKWNKILHSDERLRARLEDYHKKLMVMFHAMLEQQRNRAKIVVMLQEPEPDWEEIEKLESAAQWAAVNLEKKGEKKRAKK